MEEAKPLGRVYASPASTLAALTISEEESCTPEALI